MSFIEVVCSFVSATFSVEKSAEEEELQLQRDDDCDMTDTLLLEGQKANAAAAEEHRRISFASILIVPEFVR